MTLTTRKMSDAHELYLVEQFGGRRTKGSGNQWSNPMDGRHNQILQESALAWDGKSTLSKSVGVSLAMWEKAVEQAGMEEPMLALRWYRTERLDVLLDLAVVRTPYLARLVQQSNELALISPRPSRYLLK